MRELAAAIAVSLMVYVLIEIIRDRCAPTALRAVATGLLAWIFTRIIL